MKKIAEAFSYLLHPIWIPFALSIVLMHFCPTLFANIPAKELGLVKIQIGANTILYPLLVSFLLWRLGFAKNLKMETNIERLAPLMAAMLFYFWNFYALKKSTNEIPKELLTFLLGTFISTCILFFTTIFTKMSLHTAAMSGALTTVILWMNAGSCIPLSVVIIFSLLFIITVVSRKVLQAHTYAELVSGAVIGVASMVMGGYFL
jgi:hypothetical protein